MKTLNDVKNEILNHITNNISNLLHEVKIEDDWIETDIYIPDKNTIEFGFRFSQADGDLEDYNLYIKNVDSSITGVDSGAIDNLLDFIDKIMDKYPDIFAECIGATWSRNLT